MESGKSFWLEYFLGGVLHQKTHNVRLTPSLVMLRLTIGERLTFSIIHFQVFALRVKSELSGFTLYPVPRQTSI